MNEKGILNIYVDVHYTRNVYLYTSSNDYRKKWWRGPAFNTPEIFSSLQGLFLISQTIRYDSALSCIVCMRKKSIPYAR